MSLPRWLLPLSFALSLLLAGCVRAEFEPRSAVVEPPVVEHAIQVYEDDMPAVKAAGGKVIGSVKTQGNQYANVKAMASKASTVAAENGGTHFILTDRGEKYYVMNEPGHVSTTCAGDTCSSSYSPPTRTTIAQPTAGFVVIRVPDANWEKLPQGLKPQRLQP